MTGPELVSQFYALARAGDFDAAETMLADDLVIHEAPSLPFGGEWRGRDSFRRLVPAVMGYWIDPRVTIDNIVGDDTNVVALITFEMTSRTTGERFTQNVAEVSRIESGQIAEMRIHYFDTVEVARQLAP